MRAAISCSLSHEASRDNQRSSKVPGGTRGLLHFFYCTPRQRSASAPDLPWEEQDVSEGREEGRGCLDACVTERLHWLLAGLVRPYCLHILRSQNGI